MRPDFFKCRRRGGRLFPEFFTDKAEAALGSRGKEIRTKCGITRTKCVRFGDLMDTRRAATLPWRGRVGTRERSECVTGWGDVSTRGPSDIERPSPHPDREFHSRSTLPLQGRVKRVCGCNIACYAWRRTSPSLALTSAILARLTGTRCGEGPASSITAPSPSLRTRETWVIDTIWLRCTRTNRPGSSCASA